VSCVYVFYDLLRVCVQVMSGNAELQLQGAQMMQSFLTGDPSVRSYTLCIYTVLKLSIIQITRWTARVRLATAEVLV
jgi:hypothetical protein